MRLNLALTILAGIGVINGFRLYPALPGGQRWRLLLGAGVVLGVAAFLASAGDTLLDWLDISPESFRIAAGAVLTFSAARTLVWPRAQTEPELSGRWATLVPITFPLLLTPELAVLALTVGADHDVGRVVLAVGLGLGLVVLVDLIPRRAVSKSVMAGTARIAASALAVAAVALVIDGIRDV